MPAEAGNLSRVICMDAMGWGVDLCGVLVVLVSLICGVFIPNHVYEGMVSLLNTNTPLHLRKVSGVCEAFCQFMFSQIVVLQGSWRPRLW